MRSRDDFKAYKGPRELVLHCWTAADVAFEAEKAAFQSRLNRFELSRVEVIPANGPAFTMRPLVERKG